MSSGYPCIFSLDSKPHTYIRFIRTPIKSRIPTFADMVTVVRRRRTGHATKINLLVLHTMYFVMKVNTGLSIIKTTALHVDLLQYQ